MREPKIFMQMLHALMHSICSLSSYLKYSSCTYTCLSTFLHTYPTLTCSIATLCAKCSPIRFSPVLSFCPQTREAPLLFASYGPTPLPRAVDFPQFFVQLRLASSIVRFTMYSHAHLGSYGGSTTNK